MCILRARIGCEHHSYYTQSSQWQWTSVKTWGKMQEMVKCKDYAHFRIQNRTLAQWIKNVCPLQKMRTGWQVCYLHYIVNSHWRHLNCVWTHMELCTYQKNTNSNSCPIGLSAVHQTDFCTTQLMVQTPLPWKEIPVTHPDKTYPT